MKRILALFLCALLMAAPALAEGMDVQGFWYSDAETDGFELVDGIAILSDEDGATVAEGTYIVDGAEVLIMVDGVTYQGAVSGNDMMIDGTKNYSRDGIEENYWVRADEELEFELFDGDAWMYDNEGDLIAEGSYQIDGVNLVISIEGRELAGEIDIEALTLTLDGEVYSPL